MRFEQLLHHLDHGLCLEQLQREAVLDIVILLMCIDGDISKEEKAVVYQSAKHINWDNSVHLDGYVSKQIAHCITSIQLGHIEPFIQHRVAQLTDPSLRKMALEFANAVITADKKLTTKETTALNLLETELLGVS